jgi:hypothetical protein
VLTGLRLLFEGDRPVQPERNLFVRGLRRLLPMSPEHAEARFLVRREGRLMATALLPALLAVESTDLVFALDSIPAVSESATADLTMPGTMPATARVWPEITPRQPRSQRKTPRQVRDLPRGFDLPACLTGQCGNQAPPRPRAFRLAT